MYRIKIGSLFQSTFRQSCKILLYNSTITNCTLPLPFSKAMSPEGAEISTIPLPDGRKISYRLSGPSSDHSPIVLLSNSLMAPYQTLDNYVDHLTSQNFRVLCYDQAGHGLSTTKPSTVESTTFTTLAADVRVLLDALEIKQLHAWVGISMGAATGFYFSIQNPGRVKKLVLCDTISCSPKAAGIADPFEARVQTARTEGKVDTLVDATIERWFSKTWRENNAEEVKRMRRIMRTTQVEGFVACCRAIQDERFDMRPLTGKVGESVESCLIVVGELDANLPDTMSELRTQIHDSYRAAGKNLDVLYSIKGAGHVCVVDGFEDYKNIVTEFLKG